MTPTEALVPQLLPVDAIPGPKGCLLFGSLPEMKRDAIGTLAGAARDFGDISRIKLVADMVLLAHPDHVKHVLQDNHLNYQKGFGYDRMAPLVGNGLLLSEGDFWKRQRRLAQPAFHRQRIAGFLDIMVRRTQQLLDGWAQLPTGKVIDVHAEMMRLTFAIVGDALFSVDLLGEAEATGKALTTALEIINDRFQQMFVTPKFIPTSENRRLSAALEVLDGVVNKIIAERRANPAVHNDLLGMLMEAKDEDTGETMTDAQLRDEVMTMVLAGHETTANALSWAWYLLSRSPHVTRKLEGELQQSLGGKAPALTDFQKLTYTTQVIEEAMRLYPPAWLIGRRSIAEDQIGGYRLPANTPVFLCPYITHRDPRWWENPEGFDPERFTPENAARRPRLAYFPFAAGPRKCIGDAFATMEMQVVLAMIAQRYELHLASAYKVEPDPQVTLRPKDGIHMTVHARS